MIIIKYLMIGLLALLLLFSCRIMMSPFFPTTTRTVVKSRDYRVLSKALGSEFDKQYTIEAMVYLDCYMEGAAPYAYFKLNMDEAVLSRMLKSGRYRPNTDADRLDRDRIHICSSFFPRDFSPYLLDLKKDIEMVQSDHGWLIIFKNKDAKGVFFHLSPKYCDSLK